MTARRAAVLAGVLGAAVLPGACSALEDTPPPCPEVRLLDEGQRLVRYRPGEGRDVTDMVAEARLVGYQGSCAYTDTGVDLLLAPVFEVEKGPAADSDSATVPWFVALPAFHPDPAAKRLFRATVPFPDNTGRVRYREGQVRVVMPLDDPRRQGPEQTVYLGLQLSREQLDRQRRQRQGE